MGQAVCGRLPALSSWEFAATGCSSNICAPTSNQALLRTAHESCAGGALKGLLCWLEAPRTTNQRVAPPQNARPLRL